jgi:hypothetical protein
MIAFRPTTKESRPLLGSILSLKSLSKDKTDKCNLVKDADFLEWFRGFTVAALAQLLSLVVGRKVIFLLIKILEKVLI